MKRRHITDSIELDKGIVLSLIKTMTEKFGTPRRYRHIKLPGSIYSIRFTFTWSLSKVTMAGYSSPPSIKLFILNNTTFSPTSKSPRNHKLYRRKARVFYHGYNGKSYNIFTEIMDKV